MDIPLYFAVMRRFWKIVLVGFVLAIALAFLSYGRGSVTYESQAEALITQQSFPYGRAAAPGGANAAGSVLLGSPGVLSGLSPVYAQLANSDQIQKTVLKQAKVAGTITASGVNDPATGFSLPFLQLVSTAPTAAGAATLAQLEFNVLAKFITQQQANAGIPANDRVQLVLIENGNPPKIAGGRSASIPMLVFVAVLGAAIAIAFFKEKSDPQTAAKLGRVPAGQPQFAHGEPHGVLAPDVCYANGATAYGNGHGAAGAPSHPAQASIAPGAPNVAGRRPVPARPGA